MRPPRNPNVLVALIEQNPGEREYLRALIASAPGLTLAGAYGSLAEALPELEKPLPSIVITDLEAAGDSPKEWLSRVHDALPHAAVLVLSVEKDRDRMFQVFEAGVSAWLQKPCSADQILRAIVIVHEGGAVLSSPVARKILEYFHARGSSLDCLSHREREILTLFGRGMRSPDIAGKLGLSPSTIQTHVRNMLAKLDAGSRAEAVARYLNPRATGAVRSAELAES